MNRIDLVLNNVTRAAAIGGFFLSIERRQKPKTPLEKKVDQVYRKPK
jgi:hypothetical protein